MCGDGSVMVMENTRDSIIGGEKLETPTEKYSKADASTSSEKKISPSASVAETTEKASPGKNEQLPQLPQSQKQALNELKAQSWMEVLRQTRKNGAEEGIGTIAQTVWKDGVPMIVLAVYPAFVCGHCGNWNYGTKCRYSTCGNYDVEVKP